MTQEANSSKKVKESSDSDIISQLPDHILCSILSFLETVEAVATCILSKRWKNVWKSIPKLRFDDNLPPFNITDSPFDDPEGVKFANFVNRVLILHNNTQFIQEFYLRSLRIHDMRDVGVWISNVIMKGVKILDVDVYCDENNAKFTSSVFACETLEVLRLRSSYLNVPARCCLPRLRAMELKSVDVYGGGITRLISSCPCLESLNIQRVGYDDEPFNISSSSLRMLSFCNYHHSKGGEHKLEIDCPALQSVSIISYYLCIGFDTSIFTSNMLEVLVLEYVSLVGSPSKICLPKLRSLKLHFIRCKYDEYVANLISSCTSLESLDIIQFGFNDTVVLNISSTTLRVLNIKHLVCKRGLKLALNAPALRSLGLFDLVMEDYRIENLSSLEEASINSNFPSTCTSTYQAIRSVKTLSIEANSLSALIPEHGLPMFPRLTVFKVEARCCKWKMLQEFIKNSDKLEDLAIVMSSCGKDKHEICWRDFQSVPMCLISSLRTVSIAGIRSLEDELAMVAYILKHSRLLHTMKIEVSHIIGDKTKNELIQKLLGFCRGYEKCKILIADVS